MYIHIYILYVCTYVCMYVGMSVRRYVRRYVCKVRKVCMYICLFVCMHDCVHACMSRGRTMSVACVNRHACTYGDITTCRKQNRKTGANKTREQERARRNQRAKQIARGRGCWKTKKSSLLYPFENSSGCERSTSFYC